MGKPGGGRAEISPRILSKFHIINYTIPTQSNMRKIFETIGIYKFNYQHFRYYSATLPSYARKKPLCI